MTKTTGGELKGAGEGTGYGQPPEPPAGIENKPRPSPATQPLTHDEDSAQAVTAKPFGKINVELRNASDVFFNSEYAAWTGQLPTGNAEYANAVIRAIRKVNDDFEDRWQNEQKRVEREATKKSKG